MRNERARELTDKALTQLSEALAAGKSDTLEAFLRIAARFRHYSFRNQMLIATQRPDATQVAGFRAWKKLGRFVRAGEKGILIVAPVPIPQGGPAANGESAPPEMRFKAAYVFDISQTEGEPLPELDAVSGDPGAHPQVVRELVARKGITLEYVDDLPGALGTSSGGRIRIVRDLTPGREFEVLVHELAHEMLHRDADRATRSHAVCETEAEAVAFIVCEAIGLTTGTAAADYIQLEQGSAELLAASLARIRDAAAEILETILGEGQKLTAPEAASA